MLGGSSEGLTCGPVPFEELPCDVPDGLWSLWDWSLCLGTKGFLSRHGSI